MTYLGNQPIINNVSFEQPGEDRRYVHWTIGNPVPRIERAHFDDAWLDVIMTALTGLDSEPEGEA